MGLDIYLYRYDNFEDSCSREEKYNDFSDELFEEYGNYSSLTEEQKNELNKRRKEFANSLNLDEWGYDKTNCEKIEENHPEYTDHYFKIGYFRSSYNDSGIERILSNLGVPNMKNIFKYNGDYYFQPNWEESLEKCEVAIHQLKSIGPYRVKAVTGNMFTKTEIESEKDAMNLFLEEINNNKKGGYLNAKGEFHHDEPLEVLAMIPGKTTIFKEVDCVYVVTKEDNSWYVQALEIIRDTIKYVLSKENKEQYYLHWSG